MEHREIVLGESQLIKIDANNENAEKSDIVIDFLVGLPYCAHDSRSISPLVSSPILSTFTIGIEYNQKPQFSTQYSTR